MGSAIFGYDGPGGRRDVRLIHHPRVSQPDEPGPSQSLYRPRPIVPAVQSGEGPVDLGYLIRGDGSTEIDSFRPTSSAPWKAKASCRGRANQPISRSAECLTGVNWWRAKAASAYAFILNVAEEAAGPAIELSAGQLA